MQLPNEPKRFLKSRMREIRTYGSVRVLLLSTYNGWE